MKVLAILLVVAVLGNSIAYGLSHGEDCNASTVCDKAAGLICSKENKCNCTSGVLTQSINYTFEWDDGLKKCTSILNSGCVGTAGFDVNELPKDVNQIQCSSGLICVQVPTLPPLVGVCKEHGGEDDGSGSKNLGSNALAFYLTLLVVFVCRR